MFMILKTDFFQLWFLYKSRFPNFHRRKPPFKPRKTTFFYFIEQIKVSKVTLRIQHFQLSIRVTLDYAYSPFGKYLKGSEYLIGALVVCAVGTKCVVGLTSLTGLVGYRGVGKSCFCFPEYPFSSASSRLQPRGEAEDNLENLGCSLKKSAFSPREKSSKLSANSNKSPLALGG